MASNATSYDLPPLPEYTLKPLTPLVSWASDAAVQTALPIVAYWVVSLIFHLIDVYDLFAQYRLHTPAEVLKRNHVTRWEVFRDVVLQQVIQSIALMGLSYYDDAPTTGTADYDVAWYAQKLRLVQRAVPFILSTIGLNPTALATKLSAAQPTLAAVVAGGRYPGLPAFTSWELSTASFLYWYAVPAVQFMAAIIIIDAWEYMLHRAMHMNKWLYGEQSHFNFHHYPADSNSDLSLAPPSSLRSLRLRCPLQPPSRGLCA
jgi:sphinganine C4-monooxygenase